MTFAKLGLSLLLTAGMVIGSGFWVTKRAVVREAQAESAYPPNGQILMVEGARVHAYVEGDGPDLVLIHGAGGNLREFTFELVAKLAPFYRVIAFDRPGLGFSQNPGDKANDPREQARLLQAAAAQLQVKNPIVLGHSYGGAVAMGWALNAQADTRALVIVSGATMPFPGDVDNWYKLTGGLAARLIDPVLTAFATKAQAEASIKAVFAPDPVPDGYGAHIGAGLTLRRASLRANGRQVLALKAMLIDMAPRYAALSLPVEILHGTADTTVRPEIHAEPLTKSLPNANLTLIEGAGHMPHHLHLDVVIAAIARAAAR
jgi:pimeloyl-ACP methyl ester carboxylesterase